MFGLLLKQQFLEIKRSVMWRRGLIANIFMSILLVFTAFNLLVVGLLVEQLLRAIAPDKSPVEMFNSILVYFLGIDLIMRFLLQKTPGLSIKPYLYLPISRSVQTHFLMLKSILNWFSLYPLFVLIPFGVKVVSWNHSPLAALIWFTVVFCLILINSLLTFFIKNKIVTNPKLVGQMLIVILGLISMDYFHYFSLSAISADFFGYFIQHPIYSIFPAVLFGMFYFYNFRFLKSHFYLDALSRGEKKNLNSFSRIGFLEKYGEIGQYLALELKLMFRNRRPRALLIISLPMPILCYFIFSIMPVTKESYYPNPKPKVLASLQNQESPNRNEGMKQVTLKVFPEQLPENSYVYLAGSEDVLGNWKAGKVPTIKNSDGSWSRTLQFHEGQEIKFKFNLGSWQTQRLNDDGTVPNDYILRVKNDTTAVYTATGWAVPEHHFMLDFNLIYISLLLIGSFMISYGQFMMTWESSYFDSILSKQINMFNYLKAKLVLMVFSTLILYLLALPLIYLGKIMFLVTTAAFMYNIGVNSFLLFFLTMFNRKRIDLNASLMSSQGKNKWQGLTIIPIAVLPAAFFLPFGLYDQIELGFLFFAVVGLLGLLFHKPLLNLIIKHFLRQKYAMAAGFREK